MNIYYMYKEEDFHGFMERIQRLNSTESKSFDAEAAGKMRAVVSAFMMEQNQTMIYRR